MPVVRQAPPRAVPLSAGFVADAVGGRLVSGDRARVFDTVSTDSRSLTGSSAARALFIALAGPNFDGHEFVPALLQAGLAGVIVSRPIASAAAPAVVIEVDDTLRALQRLGRAVRRASGATVIAITGSAGKTTTKELTADALAAKYRVFRNAGNLNNHIGLPLSLLELRHGNEIAVVELGMNHAGEIRTLVDIAEPDIRMWTNVGDAHIGHFGSRDAIADAKAEILEQATPDTTLIANADDPLITARRAAFPGRTVTFGESAGADVRATDVEDRGFDGTRAVVTAFGERFAVEMPLPGRANLLNALAAAAVALDRGVSPAEVVSRLAAARPVSRRGEVTSLANGARLVDDSYNASPAAVRHALAALAATPAARRVAVLGEMRELGDLSQALHRAIGEAAAAAGVARLFAVGGDDARAMADAARAAGVDAEWFETSAAAADAVPARIQSGDLVLVKGSRGTRTDIVADRLKERG
jgi:UDP-N-acetylmuramoyl-tripeptide--D-alanyl-D-alanine ligase